MKILVVIANYGTKGRKYLTRVLAEYRSMPWSVRVVVLSNIPKDLGPGVEVAVGLPAKDPRSLPFGYKKVFAQCAQDYDLFIYSEDDVLITERNLRAFLRATELLPPEYIAGFLRTEVSAEGKRYYSTIHAHYHWDANSVMKLDDCSFARYTNEHSGCFVFTKAQLAKAMKSPGFLLGFRKGRYGYLETAATDPYTQSGFKKVICISHLGDFCLPHLPNLYCGKIGVDAQIADREIAKLISLNGRAEIRGPLFETEARLERSSWDKQYYEFAREDVLEMVPREAKTILSVGCGWGETEGKLVERGVEIVGIPLDCVIAVTAKARGVHLVPPDLELARQQLSSRRFDCIIFSDSLHRFADPVAVLKLYNPLLEPRGVVIVSAPNFNHFSVLRDRALGRLKLPGARARDVFAKYGLHLTTFRTVRQWLQLSGLDLYACNREVPRRFRRLDRLTFGLLREMLAGNLVVVGRRLI